jgi:hypothetical protein
LLLLPDDGGPALDVAESGVVLRQEAVHEVDSAPAKLLAKAVHLEFNLK